MTEQKHPDYHEGFFDALDGEPLFEDECSQPYLAGWLAAHECRSYFDRQWEDVPAEQKHAFRLTMRADYTLKQRMRTP